MIRTTITIKEFEQLTWLSFYNIASDINDIEVSLLQNDSVLISVLGEELRNVSLEYYKSIIK